MMHGAVDYLTVCKSRIYVFANPCQLFNECGGAVWGTSSDMPDALEFHAKWGTLSEDVRNVEVVWSPAHRDTLGRLLLEQLQASKCSPPYAHWMCLNVWASPT